MQMAVTDKSRSRTRPEHKPTRAESSSPTGEKLSCPGLSRTHLVFTVPYSLPTKWELDISNVLDLGMGSNSILECYSQQCPDSFEQETVGKESLSRGGEGRD